MIIWIGIEQKFHLVLFIKTGFAEQVNNIDKNQEEYLTMQEKKLPINSWTYAFSHKHL